MSLCYLSNCEPRRGPIDPRRAVINPDPGPDGAPPRFQVTEISQGNCMSRVCEVTGKKPAVGNRVSHANNKKRRRFLPNLHTQRFWVETEKRWVTLRLSASGMRTIEKRGIDKVLAELRAQGHKL